MIDPALAKLFGDDAARFHELLEKEAHFEQLRAMLQEFIDFQNGGYERFADLARDYCVLRRKARALLGEGRAA